MKPKNPCYGCQQRHALCHNECKLYAEWKSEHEKERDRIWRAKMNEALLEQYGKSTHRRLKKARGDKRDK